MKNVGHEVWLNQKFFRLDIDYRSYARDPYWLQWLGLISGFFSNVAPEYEDDEL